MEYKFQKYFFYKKMDNETLDKTEKNGGNFCLGYDTGQGIAKGFKDGMSRPFQK